MMIRNILNETPLEELDKSSELFKIGSERQYLGVWTFINGSKEQCGSSGAQRRKTGDS